jgi:hypothetical protein
VLARGDDVVHYSVQGLPGQAEREAFRCLSGHMSGPGQCIPVDKDVDHDRSEHADVRAITVHCPEGPLKSRLNNDEFQRSSRSSVTSTFRANLEAP